jgi:hypothetical protein
MTTANAASATSLIQPYLFFGVGWMVIVPGKTPQ